MPVYVLIVFLRLLHVVASPFLLQSCRSCRICLLSFSLRRASRAARGCLLLHCAAEKIVICHLAMRTVLHTCTLAFARCRLHALRCRRRRAHTTTYGVHFTRVSRVRRIHKRTKCWEMRGRCNLKSHARFTRCANNYAHARCTRIPRLPTRNRQQLECCISRARQGLSRCDNQSAPKRTYKSKKKERKRRGWPANRRRS